jgi:G3E family GTPase
MRHFPSPEIGMFGRRQRHAHAHRIPVTIVTGFLGAGKTTLVQRFLKTAEGRNTAVVVNEFGAVGIDDALLRSSADETVLLGNGCLCCNVRSDLQLALRRLTAERTRGEIYFARVVIETSGLADPGPILRTFATDRALGEEFHVAAVIAVVDALTGPGSLDHFAEARAQVILADRLILSKTDLAGAAELTGRLRALNPRAEIIAASHGELDPRCLTEAAQAGDRHFLGEAAHSDGIVSFLLVDDAPLGFDTFSRCMETLTALRGGDLLRVKGLLNIAGCRGPVVVQFVQHLADPPVELGGWTDHDRRSRLVFITRGVPEQAVRSLFDAVRALSSDTPRHSHEWFAR